MARVHLWASLRRFAEGQEVVEVEAATVGQMLDALERAHPGLGPAIKAGLSVAVRVMRKSGLRFSTFPFATPEGRLE